MHTKPDPLTARTADQPCQPRAVTLLRLVITTAAVIGGIVAISPLPTALAANAAAMSTAVGLPGVDAGVLTWGEGDHGELGDGLTDSHLQPTLYAGPNQAFTQVSMTADHAIALALDGTVWGWGDNTRDQVLGGVNAPAFYQSPVQVSGLSNVVQVATGGPFSLAVTQDGSVYQWGEDLVAGNNLGGPGTFDLSVPTLVSGVSHIVKVSAYATHALLLSSDGSVYSWGDNPDGVLGTGDTSRRAHPTKINGLPVIGAIATGLKHSLAAGYNGQVYSWGDNSYGQLGLGLAGPVQSTTPTPVLGLPAGLDVRQLAAGFSHSLALFTNGTVYTWGDNSSGQLGGDFFSFESLPRQVPGLSAATSIAAAPYGSLAVQSAHLWEWGLNEQGQLGNGSLGGTFNSPQEVPNLPGVVSAATGTVSSAAAVHQPASLSMTLSPAAATVTAGDSTTTTVSFSPSRGLIGDPVNLSVSGLPSGVTASFTDSAPDSGATSVLTLTASNAIASGIYHITVNASAGTFVNPVSASATYNLTVRPDFAITLSPTEGTAIGGGSVTTQVSLSLGSGFSGGVNLAVSNLPDGTTAAFGGGDVTVSPVTLTLTSAGTPSGVYDIYVNAITADGTSTRTAIFELTVTGQADRGGN